MDETALVITVVSATAATVGAFWLRTENIRETVRADIDRRTAELNAENDAFRKWVDEKYMTREAINLKFDAIQAGLSSLGAQMGSFGMRIDTMEQRQRVQIQYLKRIYEKQIGKKEEDDYGAEPS